MKVRATQQVEVDLDVHTQYEVTMNFVRNIFDLPGQYVYEGKWYRSHYDGRCDDIVIGDATEDDIAKYNTLKYIEKEYKNSKHYK